MTAHPHGPTKNTHSVEPASKTLEKLRGPALDISGFLLLSTNNHGCNDLLWRFVEAMPDEWFPKEKLPEEWFSDSAATTPPPKEPQP